MTELIDSKQPHHADLACETVDQGTTVPVMNRIRHVVQPGGRKNRNAVLMLFIGGSVLLVILWIVSGAGSAHAADATNRARSTGTAPWAEGGRDEMSPLVSAPPPAAILGPPARETPPSETPAPIPASYYTNNGARAGSPSNGQASVSSIEGASRAEVPDSTVKPAKSVFAVNPKEEFVHRFRASNDAGKPEPMHVAERQNGPATKASAEPPEIASLLPSGLQIAMKLLDPVATGLKSRARIRVMADTFDPAGRLLVPAGTEGDLPFAPGEILGGRVVLSDNEKGVLRIGGQELAIAGSIRDKDDGRVGLKGKIKKSGGSSVMKRSVGALGRAASGIAMRAGAPVYDLENVVGSSVGDYSGQSGTTREVVVEKDTRFTFVVGK